MADEPRLHRSITLHFMGDWGQANLHRVCGWLAQEVGDRSGAHSRFAIWNGRGGVDAVGIRQRRTDPLQVAEGLVEQLFVGMSPDRVIDRHIVRDIHNSVASIPQI